MPKFFMILSLILLLFSCSSNEEKPPEKADTAAKVEPLYPFPQYLASQVNYVDSTPLAVEKIVRINGMVTDSGYIEKSQFDKEIAPLIAVDPNETKYRSKYEETSFQDLSLEAVTFSITTTDPDLVLQEADILLKHDSKKVKNVILKRNLNIGDSTVNQQILWVHNMKCQVSENIQDPSGRNYTRIIEYVWDKPMNKFK